MPLLSQGRSAPVGKAHPRMPLCLIDEYGRVLQEPNQRGEICMLGACVTRGYVGDPEKTEQAYIKIGEERAFRTQDIGYLDDNENLFIVGRMGGTVKVAGYRIDFGEVESAATVVPEIHLACCFVQDLPDDKQELWLAVEPKINAIPLNIYSIKKLLRQTLPSYMVPKRILVLNQFPQNVNGKVDRRLIKSLAINSQHESAG